MIHKHVKVIALTLLMLGSAALAQYLKPTRFVAHERQQTKLNQVVPGAFAEWVLDTSMVPVTAAPDVSEMLAGLYDDLLERTYVNKQGYRVMLSIAYGSDQRGEKNQVHRPEYCYSAQGFLLTSSAAGSVPFANFQLPVQRLTARMQSRNEPITYWLTINNEAVLPGWSRKITQLKYGFSGVVPDGLLIRVSSIDSDSAAAYKIQEQFIQELLQALNDVEKARFFGSSNINKGTV